MEVECLNSLVGKSVELKLLKLWFESIFEHSNENLNKNNNQMNNEKYKWSDQ